MFKDFVSKYKIYLIIALVAVVGIVLDIITKNIFYGQNYTLIGGFISIYSTLNTGAGWSMFSDKTTFLILLSILILIILVVIVITHKSKSKFYSIAIGLIFAGAIGNLIDRVFLLGVRDFIKLDFISFPIFNVADICLTIGAILVCFYLLFIYKPTPKIEKTIPNSNNSESSISVESNKDKKEEE